MRKPLSFAKITKTLFIITVIFLVFYTYMLARPISYGMEYKTFTEYEGEIFEGSITYKSYGVEIIKNSSMDEEVTSYYYYQDGYVFTLTAKTVQDAEKESQHIKDNFDTIVTMPFSAIKINAFRTVAEGIDGYLQIYTCKSAIIFAIIGGVIGLCLIALTIAAYFIAKKIGPDKNNYMNGPDQSIIIEVENSEPHPNRKKFIRIDN